MVWVFLRRLYAEFIIGCLLDRYLENNGKSYNEIPGNLKNDKNIYREDRIN